MAEPKKWWEDVLTAATGAATIYGTVKTAQNTGSVAATPPYLAPTPPQFVYLPATPVKEYEKKKDNTLMIVGIVGGVLVLCAVLFFAFKK